MREALCQFVDSGEIFTFADATRSVGLGRLGVLNLGRRQGTASRDVGRLPTSMAGTTRAGFAVTSGNIENIELAASGGLDGEVNSGIVGDVVAIHDVVVPVATTKLQDRGLEAEFASPCARLGGVLGQGKFARVAIPGTDEMHGFDASGSANRKVKLNGGHFE